MPSFLQLVTNSPAAPTQFLLSTGNINHNLELKKTNFTNSAEELEQWIALQSKYSLNCKPATDRMNTYSRDELKVTLKIFMTKWEVDHIQEAVDALKKELNIKDIESLIVALPSLKAIPGESNVETLHSWLYLATPIYNRMNELVETSIVGAIGLADITLEQLEKLQEFAIKPSIVHINADRQVGDLLRALAVKEEVQLLAHNDPNPLPTDGIEKALGKIAKPAKNAKTMWLARYTVFIRTRAVLISKGYLARLEINNLNLH